MKNNFYAWFLLFFMGFSFALLAQQRVDITTCDNTGTGIICVAEEDSLYSLCVQITPGPCSFKKFEIDWGDGKKETFTMPTDFKKNHTYDLRNFAKSCGGGEQKFDIFIETDCATGNDNKGFRVKFNKKPRARPGVSNACEGATVRLTNNTCPSSSDVTYLWDLGNGQTSTQFLPSVTYPDPTKTYTLKLTATTPNCNSNTAEILVKLKKLPEAKYITSGYSIVNKDTVVCLSNGGTLTLDGTLSLDATQYRWNVSPSDYKFINNTNANSPKPVIQFSKSGTYTITLTATNDCGQSKPLLCKHEVIASPQLSLPKQADVCQAPFRYKFTPQSGVSYTLNGKAFDPNAGEDLAFQSTPYVVEAALPNPCGGTLTERDTFLVAALTQVKITTPPRDTTLCVGNAALVLAANVVGGSWSGSSLVETQGTRTLFNPKTLGRYTLRYVVGSGSCVARDSLIINVQGVQAVARDTAVCGGGAGGYIRLSASPTGGRWTTGECSNCLKGDSLLLTGLNRDQINLIYEVTSSAGCRATARAVVSIGRPKADFDLADGCAGGLPKLNNRSTGASSYRWFVNGVAVANVASPQLNLPTGRVTVKLVVGTGACTDSITKQITITAPPVSAKFTASVTQGCSPLRVVLTATETERADVEYNWAIGDATTPFRGFQPPPQVFQNNSTRDRVFKIKFNTRNGCGVKNDSVEATVRPLAKAEIGLDSTAFRCTPATVKFSNRSTGHDKPQSRWIFGDGSTRTTPNDTVWHEFAARDTARTYYIRLEVASACGRDTDQVSIRVFPTIVRPLFTLSQAKACPNEPIRLTDATVPKPTRWVWKFGDGEISTQANPTHTYKSPGNYKITLTAYTPCGYDSTRSPVVFTVTEAPKGDFKPETPFGCATQPLRFVNASSPSLGYVWDFGDGSKLDSLNYSPTHTYRDSAPRTVTLTLYGDTKGCKTDIKKPLAIRPKTIADFRAASDSIFCSPGPVQLLNLSKNAEQWRWTFSDGQTSTLENPTLLFPKGHYDAKLVVSAGGVCRDSVERLLAFVVDSCQVEIPQAFTPDGNGIGDRYTLFGTGIQRIKYLRIRNRWGEIIFEMNNVPAGSQQPSESWDGTFNGQLMPADMYVFEAEVAYVGVKQERKLKGNFYLIRK